MLSKRLALAAGQSVCSRPVPTCHPRPGALAGDQPGFLRPGQGRHEANLKENARGVLVLPLPPQFGGERGHPAMFIVV